VFGSCAALGLSARQNLRRRVAAADAMLLALGLIRSEISGRRTPMPEIVGLLTENEQPIIRKVFRTLQRRLREHMGKLDETMMKQVDGAIAVSFGLHPETMV